MIKEGVSQGDGVPFPALPSPYLTTSSSTLGSWGSCPFRRDWTIPPQFTQVTCSVRTESHLPGTCSRLFGISGQSVPWEGNFMHKSIMTCNNESHVK